MNWKDKIRDADCELCPLFLGAEHVCLMGAGSRKSEVMIVGEAPGAREDETHQAFVGPAGKLLNKLLTQAGLSRDGVYITNAVKCRPPDNRTPTRGELKTCSNNYLAQEIEKVGPDHILVLGNAALQAVVGRSGITKYRGKIFELGETKVFPTFHPAYVLRNPFHEDTIKADFERFGRLVRGDESNAVEPRVIVVRTKKALAAAHRFILESDRLYFDIETHTVDGSGLEDWHGDRSKIVSVAFGRDPDLIWFIPLWHEASPWADSWEKVLAYLKRAFEKVLLEAHNGKFDCRWFASKGVYTTLKFDTMLAAHCLDENRPKALETLSQILLGANEYGMGDAIKDAHKIPLKRLARYNARDVSYGLQLKSIFKRQLLEDKRSARCFVKLTMPASNVFTKIERAGIYMDPTRHKERLSVVLANRGTVEAKMRAKVPRLRREEFNFNSPKQLAWLFFEARGNEVIEETATGAASTKEAVLLRLAQRDKLAKWLIDYRKWEKYRSTYLEAWPRYADSNSRIHPTYKLFGTVTHRLSCEHPNLQQVPRDPFIRGVLGAAPGWLLIQADYSQVELRIAAMLAGEKRMLRAFHTGEDLHVLMASNATGKPQDQITKEERKHGKSANFGFVYSMGWKKYIEYAWEKFNIEVSEHDAKKFYNTFHSTFPALKPWYDEQHDTVRSLGLVRSPLGRARHLPTVWSSDEGMRAEAERQAINSPVQTTASDLMLLSAVRLDKSLKPNAARIVGSIHDALLFEVREEYVDEASGIIKGTMEDMDYVKKEFGFDMTVPIEAELTISAEWGEDYK